MSWIFNAKPPTTGSSTTRSGPTKESAWPDPSNATNKPRNQTHQTRNLSHLLDTGHYVQPGKITVGEYLEGWLDGLALDVVSRNLRANTAESYRLALVSKVIPRIGDVPLHLLSRDDVKGLYADLLAAGGRKGKPLAPKTVRNIANTFRKALDEAVEDKLIRHSPAERVKTPKASRPRIKVWSPDETQLFLAHVDDVLRPMVHLVASTGMRRSEVLGLTWDNVNLERGVVTIAATVVVVRGKNVWQAETKTDSSRRTIAIDPGSVSMLRKHRMAQLERRMELGETWGNELNLVFTNEVGDIFSPARFTRTFQDEAKRLGLTTIGVHGLRHSLATTALRAGVPIKVVAERLGHSSTSVTMDRYSHVVEEQDREAAVMLAEMIVGTG